MKFKLFLLQERNIYNLQEIDSLLQSLRPESPQVKAWLEKQFRKWLINEYPYVKKEKNVHGGPDWAIKAAQMGELYSIEFDRRFIQKVNHLVDYLNQVDFRLDRLSVPDAWKKLKQWDEELKKQKSVGEDLKGIEVIHEYSDGFKWVKVKSKQALEREGSEMGHCVGGYCNQVAQGNMEILSLRDKNNNPHVTIEYRNKDIKQIKGKANGPVVKKYHKYVKNLLNGKIIKINKINEGDLINIGMIVDINGNLWNLDSIGNNRVVVKDLDLSNMGLKILPNLSNVIVQEKFNCSDNKLTSLEGAPQKVGGKFGCFNNQLTSLKGAPKEVGGSFRCYENKLVSLEGAPQKVGGIFSCSSNELVTLKGAPKEVGGSFYCYRNHKLKTLKGAPKEVGGGFDCYNNQLTSLEGAPQKVSGDFDCFYNELTSLEGAPKEVGGDFSCHNNAKKFTEEEVRAVSNVKGEIRV